MSSQSSVESRKGSTMDVGGLHEKAESSHWMSQLFEKLDLEVGEEDLCSTDNKTNNDSLYLKKDGNSQERGIGSSDKEVSERMNPSVRAVILQRKDDEEKTEEPMTDPDDYLLCRTHNPTGTGFENSTCPWQYILLLKTSRTRPVPHSTSTLLCPPIGARYLASDDEAKEYYSTKRRLTYGGKPQNDMVRMTDECLLAFRNYADQNIINLEDTEYRFGELDSRCYRVKVHGKIYQHFNFTMQTKLGNSGIWTSKLYFAEVKELSGVKYYFCRPLEATDDGDCYECERQQIGVLKHPRRGGYEEGYSDKFNLDMVD